MTEQSAMSMKKTKKKTWIKLYPEKWIFGSTREELTNAERAIWMDFLALAALNDPPGQIEFIGKKRLANQLNISPKLLNSTIQKATDYGKIEINEPQIGSDLNGQRKKSSSKQDQSVTKKDNLVSTQPKYGLKVKTIKILKWNEYQSEYMRQSPYRSKGKGIIEPEESKGDKRKGLVKVNLDDVTQVTDRGEERRGEENTIDKRRGDREYPSPSDLRTSARGSESNLPPDAKDQRLTELLSRLRGYADYPFDESPDQFMLLNALEEFPSINHLKELDKKIVWWKQNSESLTSKRNIPRAQLHDFFEKEHEFQSGPDEKASF